MTGGVCLVPPPGLGSVQEGIRESPGCEQYAPVNFIYRSFHDSIRSELESLLESVLALEPTSPSTDLVAALVRLRERYRFLEQVYKCHSTLEDEVRLLEVLLIVPHFAAERWLFLFYSSFYSQEPKCLPS